MVDGMAYLEMDLSPQHACMRYDPPISGGKNLDG
jgi:hypothetical protein